MSPERRELENDKLPPQALAIIVWTALAHLNFLTGPRDVTLVAGRDAWLATLLSFGLVAFCVWLPLRVSSLYRGLTVVEIARTLLGRPAGSALAAAFAVYWLAAAGWVLQSHSHVVVTHLLSETPRWITKAYLILVSTYLVRHGMEPMARLFLLLLPAYVVPILVIVISGINDMELGHLRPVLAQDPRALLRGVWVAFSQGAGMSSLWMVGPYLSRWRGAVRAAMTGISFLAVPALILMVTLISRFGPRNVSTEMYPPLSLFELVQIPGFTGFRLDPVFLTVWIGISFSSVALFHYAAASAVGRLLGVSDLRGPVWATAGVLLGLGALPVSALDIVRWSIVVMPLAVGVFSLGASVLLWVLAEVRSRRPGRGGGRPSGVRRRGGGERPGGGGRPAGSDDRRGGSGRGRGSRRSGRRSRALGAVLALGLALAAGGCWDYVDLERRSLIMTVGVDMDADDPGTLRLSVEIPVPKAADPEAGAPGPAKLVVSAAAGSLAQAANRLRGELQRQPLWDQAVAVVVSERLAREGIAGVSDVIIRFPGMNRRALFFIYEGPAEEALRFQPVLQPLTATHLRGLADQFLRHPTFAHPQEFVSVHAELQEYGVLLVPRLVMEGGMLRLTGAAVVEDGRLVGWLNDEETEGANWLLGHVLRSLVAVPCPVDDGSPIAAWVRLHRRSVRTRMEDGLPRFDILLTMTAWLVDAGRCPVVPEKASDRRRIEAELTAAVKRLAEAAVRRAQQELRVDYLRLREELRRALPAAAEELDWKQTFPAVRVDVDVRMAAGGVVFPGESLRTVPYD